MFLHASGSQTCSGRYPSQGRDYPQYFAVIAQNTQQHCGFCSALTPEELPIIPSLGTTALCIQIQKQFSIGGRRHWDYIFVGF